jgi:hypothetical protein
MAASLLLSSLSALSHPLPKRWVYVVGMGGVKRPSRMVMFVCIFLTKYRFIAATYNM